jgi:two-component system sensor histidine kinase FlrB
MLLMTMSHYTSNFDTSAIWAENESTNSGLEQAVEILPTGMVILNRRGKVELANAKARSLMDLESEHFIGRRWIEVVAHAFTARCADGHDVVTRSGRTISIETSPMPQTGQLLVLHDVTDTRELQKKMAHQQRLSSMGQMVASLAHQIRTPLSTATLYAANMSEKVLNTGQYQRFSARIHQQLQKLEQHISDMLVFARGEVIKDSKLTSGELLAEIQSTLEAQSNCQQVHFTWLNADKGAFIEIAEQTLLGAVSNLVNNAIDAASDDLHIDVYLERRLNYLVLNVRDNGPGLSSDELKKVTEAFYTTKSQGTGLGLAVVEAVAKAHGGKFTLSSVPGSGCLASIHLPIVEEDPNV